MVQGERRPARRRLPRHRDPDYQAILQAIQAAKARQEKIGRFDMPGFRPNEHYVRWMKRFGILPESFDLARDPIDVYETDQAYWRSLWRPHAGVKKRRYSRLRTRRKGLACA